MSGNIAILNTNPGQTPPNLKTIRFKGSELAAGGEAGQVLLAVNQQLSDAEEQLGIENTSIKPGPNYTKLRPKTAIEKFTERFKKFVTRIYELAYTDGVTGIENRKAFERDRKSMYIEACSRQKPFTIVWFDLDNFKRANDEYGHDAGDEALRKFAEISKKSVRGKGYKKDKVYSDVYRKGGDEFVALLYDVDKDGVMDVLEKIRKRVERELKTLNVAGKETKLTSPITVTIGYATFTPTAGLKNIKEQLKSAPKSRQRDLLDNLTSIDKLADENLYRAKKEGKNRIIGSDYKKGAENL